MISLSRWWKEGEGLDVYSTFERMEWIGIMLGAWNFRGISQTLSGLVAQFVIGLGVEPIICEVNAYCR